jgi:hypothetical protein
MPAKPGTTPQTAWRIFGQPTCPTRLDRHHVEPCAVRPQEPLLGAEHPLHYARPSQGNASQPRPCGKDRRYSLSFAMQSPASSCAGEGGSVPAASNGMGGQAAINVS